MQQIAKTVLNIKNLDVDVVIEEPPVEMEHLKAKVEEQVEVWESLQKVVKETIASMQDEPRFCVGHLLPTTIFQIFCE